MKRYIIIILSFVFCASPAASAQTDSDIENDSQQTISWSLTGGVQLTGFRMNTDNEESLPKEARPMLGMDLGLFTEYQINNMWSLRFAVIGNIERTSVMIGNHTNVITTFGTDILMPVVVRVPNRLGSWTFAAGPYTHFVLGSRTDDNNALLNPYTRVVANDPRSGETNFALGSFNAGMTASAGFDFGNRWQISVYVLWGVTDLLAADSHELYIKSYKSGLRLIYTLD